jgi:signal transduction histidine kinase/CheY-like chemotaxis protein/HPt (histidine-containing phosphotransfer) domain-containing protein
VDFDSDISYRDLFALLAAHGGAAACLYDSEERIVWWNDRYPEFFPEVAPILKRGLSSREAVLPLLKLLYPQHDTPEKLAPYIEMAEHRQRNERGPLVYQRADNGRSIELRMFPLAAGGRLKIWRDVTHEQRQVAFDEGLFEVLSFVNVGILLYGPDGTLRYANVRFLSELMTDLIPVRPPIDSRHDRAAFWRGFSGVFTDSPEFRALIDQPAGVGPEPQKVVLELRNGRWVHIDEQPWGKGEGLVSLWVDVTAHKRQEAALRAARDEAEAAVEAKSRFLAVMSHEIRTPLNGVLGMARLLERTQLDDAQRDLVRTVVDSGSALLGILNSILDYSKLEAGRVEPEAIVFSGRTVVADCVALLRGRAAEKGLSFELIVDADVPPWMRGDAGRLRQVLLNLIGNAIKFTDRGGVVVSLSRDGDGLRFAVRDTGVGISAAAQSRLFDDFTQADGTITRRFGGTGLGLAISRRLVELMGGQIGVDSREGEGSTFWFTVHLPEAPPPAETGADELPALPPLRILLVEDNSTNQQVASRLLAQYGHRVTIAGDGAEALALLDREPVDLVLMDMQMPVLDGLSATRRLRARGDAIGRLPVIAMSANTFPEDVARCREAGMDAHVPKPFDPDQLVATIAAVLAGRDAAPPPPPAPDEATAVAPLFDGDRIRRLQARLDRDAVRELIVEFLAQQGAALAALGSDDDVGIEPLARLAHTVKGSAASLGLARLAALGAEMSDRARAGDRAGALAIRHEMSSAIAACDAALDRQFAVSAEA